MKISGSATETESGARKLHIYFTDCDNNNKRQGAQGVTI